MRNVVFDDVFDFGDFGVFNQKFFNDMVLTANKDTNFPPYNFIYTGDGKYILEMAVAGYPREVLSVETENGILTIRAEKPTPIPEEKYIWKGLASRAFARQWKINGNLKVRDIRLVDGMLYVHFQQEIPEHMNVKKYEIGDGIPLLKEESQTSEK